MPIDRPAGLDVRWISRALRRRWWVVLLCSVLVPASAVGASLLQQELYTAEAQLLFRDPALDQKLFGTSSFSDPSSVDPARKAATNVELLSGEEVANRLTQRLGNGLTLEEVQAKTEVRSEGESDVVSLTATDPRPELAAEIADTFAAEYVRFRREADERTISRAQALVTAKLDRLSASELRGDAGRSLQERAEQLGILASLQTGDAEIAHRAEVPTSPSSPRPLRNGVLGLGIGVGLGLMLALLMERLDRRLRDDKEIEEIFDRPILAAVPEDGGLSASGLITDAPEGAREPFRMLRANLRYFHLRHDSRSVLITSSVSGEGKTTVAFNLALAGAAVGTRTLLIEADLRRPSLAARVGRRATPGLTTVLTGEAELSDVVYGEMSPSMDVLFSGPLPPNPIDLIESPELDELFQRAKEDYELVVVDTPPTAVVSDAIPLVRMVSGVIVVVRLGYTPREAAQRLQSQLGNLQAPTLGIVLNAVGKADGYYGYGHGDARSEGSAAVAGLA